MEVWQVILIAIFVYLGSIGSIVGNTIGWYTLGRPLVAAFVVGIIMGDVTTAMIVGIPLQIMYLGNVTPGGAVAWDLSYATYIGTAGAIVFGPSLGALEAAVLFAGIGGLIGGLMWNFSYALNLPLNRWSGKYAEMGECKKMFIPNVVGGQLIGFACRFIPAVIVLLSMNALSSQADFASLIPAWLSTGLGAFGGMMAALGMGILLSFLVTKKSSLLIFLVGFMAVTYLGLNLMSVAIFAIIAAVIYYEFVSKDTANNTEGEF